MQKKNQYLQAASQNVGSFFPRCAENLSLFMQEPTEKPLLHLPMNFQGGARGLSKGRPPAPPRETTPREVRDGRVLESRSFCSASVAGALCQRCCRLGDRCRRRARSNGRHLPSRGAASGADPGAVPCPVVSQAADGGDCKSAEPSQILCMRGVTPV